ncbi:hypothetical protein, partial [Arthrobacter sp. DR-2P]
WCPHLCRVYSMTVGAAFPSSVWASVSLPDCITSVSSSPAPGRRWPGTANVPTSSGLGTATAATNFSCATRRSCLGRRADVPDSGRPCRGPPTVGRPPSGEAAHPPCMGGSLYPAAFD